VGDHAGILGAAVLSSFFLFLLPDRSLTNTYISFPSFFSLDAIDDDDDDDLS
jgi:hypothetical protein